MRTTVSSFPWSAARPAATASASLTTFTVVLMPWFLRAAQSSSSTLAPFIWGRLGESSTMPLRMMPGRATPTELTFSTVLARAMISSHMTLMSASRGSSTRASSSSSETGKHWSSLVILLFATIPATTRCETVRPMFCISFWVMLARGSARVIPPTKKSGGRVVSGLWTLRCRLGKWLCVAANEQESRSASELGDRLGIQGKAWATTGVIFLFVTRREGGRRGIGGDRNGRFEHLAEQRVSTTVEVKSPGGKEGSDGTVDGEEQENADSRVDKAKNQGDQTTEGDSRHTGVTKEDQGKDADDHEGDHENDRRNNEEDCSTDHKKERENNLEQKIEGELTGFRGEHTHGALPGETYGGAFQGKDG